MRSKIAIVISKPSFHKMALGTGGPVFPREGLPFMTLIAIILPYIKHWRAFKIVCLCYNVISYRYVYKCYSHLRYEAV